MNSEEIFEYGLQRWKFDHTLCEKAKMGGNRRTFRDLNVYTATDTGLWVVCNNYEVLPVPYLERGESRGVLT